MSRIFSRLTARLNDGAIDRHRKRAEQLSRQCWGHMAEPGETTVERIMRRLKNNPIIAAVIVAGAAVTAFGGFWEDLPLSWRNGVIRHIPGQHPEDISKLPLNGWVFAGYVDSANQFSWSSDQRIRIMRPSGGRDRPHIVRTGDVVQPLKQVPQVIVDYRTQGTKNQLNPPWQITEVIHRADDFTGRIYTPEEQLEVMDVSVSQLPGHDYAVWLRVTPTTP